MRRKSQEFKKFAECLYRNGNDVYFALLKVVGKQIKWSLKTDDVVLAKRRLVESRGKAKRQTDRGNPDIRFEEFPSLCSLLTRIKDRNSSQDTSRKISTSYRDSIL